MAVRVFTRRYGFYITAKSIKERNAKNTARSSIVPAIATDEIPRIKTGILFPFFIIDVALKQAIDWIPKIKPRTLGMHPMIMNTSAPPAIALANEPYSDIPTSMKTPMYINVTPISDNIIAAIALPNFI